MLFFDAKKYNKNAKVQKLIAKDLVNFARIDIERGKKNLDVGCGTGFIGKEIGFKIDGLEPSVKMIELAKPYYNKIFNCRLEDFNESYDCAISSMCFQWIDNFEKKLKLFNKIWFAMPIEGSLNEISGSFEKCGIKSPIIEFKTPAIKAFAIKEFREEFPNATTTLKSFNAIGAINLEAKAPSHTEMKKINQHFNGYLTWRIGFYKI